MFSQYRMYSASREHWLIKFPRFKVRCTISCLGQGTTGSSEKASLCAGMGQCQPSQALGHCWLATVGSLGSPQCQPSLVSSLVRAARQPTQGECPVNATGSLMDKRGLHDMIFGALCQIAKEVALPSCSCLDLVPQGL